MTENAPSTRMEAILVIILAMVVGGLLVFLFSGCAYKEPVSSFTSEVIGV